MEEYQRKKAALHQMLEEYVQEDVMLAFSGGADSGLLLYMLCEKAKIYGTRVHAVTVHTTLHPAHEIEEAAREAQKAGSYHSVMEADELKEAGIAANPADRCYRCKRYLYGKMVELAAERGIRYIMEGTNEDDLHVYRPGILAVRELGIISPLAAVHMHKDEVRNLASEYGITLAKKPASPCLATRFPYGTRLRYEDMRRVERAEEFLRGEGFYNVRVRVHGDIARIEVDEKDMGKILSLRQGLLAYFRDLGYAYITLDLEGFRSGSMDINVKHF